MTRPLPHCPNRFFSSEKVDPSLARESSTPLSSMLLSSLPEKRRVEFSAFGEEEKPSQDSASSLI